MSGRWAVKTFDKPSKYENIDFAIAVFNYISEHSCPHDNLKSKCHLCRNREYNKKWYQKAKKEVTQKQRDKYHNQHPSAHFYKSRILNSIK